MTLTLDGDDDEITKMMLVRRLPLLSRLDVSHCPLLTSGGLLRLVVKSSLTHISVAGDQRDFAPISNPHLAYIFQTLTLQAVQWLQV